MNYIWLYVLLIVINEKKCFGKYEAGWLLIRLNIGICTDLMPVVARTKRFVNASFSSDDSDDDLDDYDVGNIMIVTQTPPPANKKHDRTGNFVKRARLTGEFAKIINDGLYFYEQVGSTFTQGGR